MGNLCSDTAEEDQIANSAPWLSLDEGDNNNNVRFLTYFIVALNRAKGSQVAIGEKTLTMLQSLHPLQTETALTPIINEIATIPDRIIRVLNDYHLIDAQPFHDALSFLLDNHPPHLLLALKRANPKMQWPKGIQKLFGYLRHRDETVVSMLTTVFNFERPKSLIIKPD